LYQALTQRPTTVRAMADWPAFLLAPIANDFPLVYWVQVTRELESHVNSTRFMYDEWMTDRCKCDLAPRCYAGDDAAYASAVDRLYFDKYNALGVMCENMMEGRRPSVPDDLLRAMLRGEEREITRRLRGHPRFLQLKLEDGPRANARRMAEFLGIADDVAARNIDYDSLHLNKKGDMLAARKARIKRLLEQ